MLAGTPGFQPPEQLRAENIGPECDVYAFGCVVIVLFGERVLWFQLNPYQIMLKVTVDMAKPDTSDLRPGIKELCDACV